MADVHRTVGRLNAAQKPLSNDTWCYTQRYSKLTNLFIYLSIYFCSYLRKGTLEKLKHTGIICFA